MKVIVYHSYKGGTGKTTIAVNTAVNFARKGFKTLAIDADIKAPTFESIFKDIKPQHRFNDYFETEKLKENVQIKDLPVASKIDDNLDLIFADPEPVFGEGLLSMDKSFHAKVLKKLVEIKNDFEKMGYEYIIMDTSPSLNLASINALIIANAAILVLRPNSYGIKGTSFLLENIYSMLGTLDRKDFLLFNQVVPNTEKKIMDKWIKQFVKKFKVETIGMIPCNCQIALKMLHGEIIVQKEDDESFVNILDKIINNLIKELS
ncbi:MAG: AAA family ATPase [Candidatus Heimdallarchaeota archaeon]|nr:AAA family ATPase [Candidatus Heimdallarchaeota archaeon]